MARFNASLTALLQASYFGGTGEESAYALAIHPASGDVYIAGTTTSPTLPQSAGSAQSASGGGQDVFVALFNRTLTALQRSSLLGGSGFDDISFGTALAVHPLNGDVYVVGITESGNFPVGLGAAQPTYAGSGDAFVTRFNPALTARVQSSYLGGVGEDRGGALCISPTTGDVYVGGSTVSSPFPATAGGAQAAFAGNSDGFVSRLNEALSSVLQSSYFGGNGRDTVFALAVDRSTGDILAAGQTNSSALPQMNGAAQTIPGSSFDGFVVRFNASLKSIVRSTFVGGTGAEELYAMAVHPVTGEIFVAGATTGGLTQTAAGVQPNAAGGKDGFVLSLNGALSAVQQATYYGGTGADDYVRGIALHPTAPELYIAGYTFSANFAVSPPSGGAQPASATSPDGFVARLSTDLTAVNRAPNAVSFIPQSNVPAGSRRTSNEVQMVISPNPGSNQPAYITGSASNDMCVTNTAGCCTNVAEFCSGFVSGWILGPYSFLSGDYIAVRHNAASPSGTAVTNLITGGVAFPFVTSTGNAALRCNLDVNGDNKLLATVEGLMLVRAMLGFSAAGIVAGTGVSAWEPYRVQLNTNCGTSFPF